MSIGILSTGKGRPRSNGIFIANAIDNFIRLESKGQQPNSGATSTVSKQHSNNKASRSNALLEEYSKSKKPKLCSSSRKPMEEITNGSESHLRVISYSLFTYHNCHCF